MCSLCLSLVSVLALSFVPPAANVHPHNEAADDERLQQMVKQGDPQAVPILREWLAADCDQPNREGAAVRLVQSLHGLGLFGDRRSLVAIVGLYERADCPAPVRDAAATAVARMATSSELDLLKQMVWDIQLSMKSRCEGAVALLDLEVSEGAEFLLMQYDLYRLEFRMVSTRHLAPVWTALERLDDERILQALDARLNEERNPTMQNNIRSLKERMQLNALPLGELMEIAGATDWQSGMYRRYPAIENLGRRGTADTIPFLESLKPWKADGPERARIEGQNSMILPEVVAKAVGEIRRREWRTSTLPGATQARDERSSNAPKEVRILREHTAPVRSLALSPDGKTLVSVAYGHHREGRQSTNEWIVWDVETGKILHRDRDPREGLVPHPAMTSAAFLPDGRSIVSAGRDHAIWETGSGKLTQQVERGGNSVANLSMSLSPDAKRVVCSGPPGFPLIRWDLATGRQETINVPDARVAAFLPDGRLLLSCGDAGVRLRVYNMDQDALGEVFTGASSTIGRICVAPDGRTAVTTIGGEGSLTYWDISERRLLHHNGHGSSACFSPDSRYVAAGRHDGGLVIADAATGEEAVHFTAQRDAIHAVAFLPSGTHVLTAGGGGFRALAHEPLADYAIRLWRLPQLPPLAAPLPPHPALGAIPTSREPPLKPAATSEPVKSSPLELVGTVSLGPQQGQSVHVVGSRAYVGTSRTAHEMADMKVFDVTDPAKPVLMSRWESSGANVAAITVFDRFAYLGRVGGGSVVLEVADSNRWVRGRLPAQIQNFFRVGTILYTTGMDRWRVIDATTPDQPNVVGTYPSVAQPKEAGRFHQFKDIAVREQTAYVAWADFDDDPRKIVAGLEVFDVRDPLRPVLINRIDRAEGFRAHYMAVAVDGQYLYFTYQKDGRGYEAVVDVFDIARPHEPELVASMIVGFGANDIVVRNGAAFVLGHLGMTVIDVTRPDQPRLQGAVDGLRIAAAAHATGELLYVVDNEWMRIYRLPAPVAARPVDRPAVP
jgi:WD40 repeat protein